MGDYHTAKDIRHAGRGWEVSFEEEHVAEIEDLNNQIKHLESDLAEAVRLLTDARDSVEFEVQEHELNWGERLMHKQEHAIDTLKQIEAFLAKHRSTT